MEHQVLRIQMHRKLAHALFHGLALWSLATASHGLAAEVGEPDVRADINDTYVDPELDVDEWAQRFTGESREVYTARHDVIAAMGIDSGDRVADIGAGTGIYVRLFAQRVGADGVVHAVDIAQPFLDFVAENAAAEGYDQVTTVLGGDRDSFLPEGDLDFVFHSDSYHHFEYPIALTRSHARALKPGGRLFVLDFERVPGTSPPWVLGHVRAGKETVIEEIEAAGLVFVREVELESLRDNYLLEFRRP